MGIVGITLFVNICNNKKEQFNKNSTCFFNCKIQGIDQLCNPSKTKHQVDKASCTLKKTKHWVVIKLFCPLKKTKALGLISWVTYHKNKA